MPEEVQDALGYALDLAQHGLQADYAKPMKGDLRDVLEIVADNERGDSTFRAAYTAKIGDVIYVLDAFQKNRRKGTSRRSDISTESAIVSGKHGSIMRSSKKVEFERGSGNVFADLGLANAEERQAKARLMYVINDEIKRRGLTQTRAAEVTGLNQADISRLAHGRGLKFSTDRLIDVIRRLSMDVELTVRHRESGVGTFEVRELV